ncbi:spheroidene monooxygenase [Streptomyces sp. NPDC091266]|uniref:spheroidene monooxygenase n=1 Tax=Streptomyces sp. NPDC091266 TaxID=3365978 RepID=UPI00380B33F9
MSDERADEPVRVYRRQQKRGPEVILSVHLADIGVRSVRAVLKERPRPADTPGLRYAATTFTGAIAAGPPKLRPGRAALIAAWEDDAALDRFLAEDPLAGLLAGGWQVRLRPVRISGSWSPMPVETDPAAAMDEEAEPVAVLTLGKLRLRRAVPFLRANSRAAGTAAADPALVASVALAAPPRFVGTFSIWRSVSAMSRYAYGSARPEHREAVKEHRAQAFHHEAAFVRCRPYAARGSLDGQEPVATAAAACGAPPKLPG